MLARLFIQVSAYVICITGVHRDNSHPVAGCTAFILVAELHGWALIASLALALFIA